MNLGTLQNSWVNGRTVVACFLVVHAGLLCWSASLHSCSGDEAGHLSAGISHWQLARFDLYCVNPPLVRMIAVVPVLLEVPVSFWDSYGFAPTDRMEFAYGKNLIDSYGNHSVFWFVVCRWCCIPFSLVGAYVCYRWAEELYGQASGILAGIIWCFSPNILAYGQLITPDMGAASVGVAASYLFWRWITKPEWPRALASGLVLGAVELTKSTWVVLFALWPFLWLLQCLRLRSRNCIVIGSGQLVAMTLLSICVINLGYGFEGTFRRLGDYQFASLTLGGVRGERSLAGNRFRGTAFGAACVPLPANYIQGIDVAKFDFERGLPSYLRGEWKHGGWWYYYLYAMSVKVPLGTIGLAVCAVLVRIRHRGEDRFRDFVALLSPAVCVLVLVSSQTGYTHHLRYVFPAFPFLLIFVSSVAQDFSFVNHRWLSIAICLLTAWMIASSLSVYPHSLSYFNELAGGPTNGHAHLLESNVDWGQDLLYVKQWQEKHPDAGPLALVCYSQFDPRAIGIDYWTPLRRKSRGRDDRESPSADMRYQISWKPGWYAISANYLRGMTRFPIWDGQGQRLHLTGPDYTKFLQLKPIGRFGYSIYLYYLSEEDVRRLQAD